jgi:group I intron endonuclease
MGHKPTIFYILENQTLGSWWVGKMESTLDGCGISQYRSISQDELNNKLGEKYNYTNPYLTLVTLNKRWSACYGVERWLSKLEYKISKEPEKYQELEELLKAGWDGETETSTLSVLHVLEHNQPIGKIFKKLVKSREGLTRCLNTTKYKTYEDRKKDPEFLKRISREKVIKTMEKTGKLPKPETLEKYDIRDEEIKECMGPTGIIYKISSPSGKVYVGQTMRSFQKRIRQHKSKHSYCTYLKRAIQKYGDEMKYEIIEEDVPHDQLDEREIYWIKELNSLAPTGYNCTTGGQFKTEYSQKSKDDIRNGIIKSKIMKDGYMGSVRQIGNVYYPRVRLYGIINDLSIGGFRTKEEAIEVLKEYTKDPENFTKIEGTIPKRVGCISRNRDKWKLTYKHKHIGNYATKEEAEETRQALQSSL